MPGGIDPNDYKYDRVDGEPIHDDVLNPDFSRYNMGKHGDIATQERAERDRLAWIAERDATRESD
jgi:hypothetical protein